MSYSLVEQIGKGGMGVVWKARDDETGQIVALKLLREAHLDDPEYRQRFEHEMAIASRITSQNVVKVLGYGEREGAPYIAFELVEGKSLRQMVTDHGPYKWADARAILLQLAEGLADAHATGVIHRDVKPSNILFDSAGTAKLADFGISRAADLTRMTRASGLMGTPAYLAPEGPIDARSDLYSLGVVAFELMTGNPPFDGDTYHAVLVGHMSKAPDLTKLPGDARPIVGWLLAKAPSARPQTARQLIRVLTGADKIPTAVAAPTTKRNTGTKVPAEEPATLVAPAGSAGSARSAATPAGKSATSASLIELPTTDLSPAGAAPRRSMLPAVAVAGLVVIVVGAAVIFASRGSGAGSPTAAVSASLIATATTRPSATPVPTPTPKPTPTPLPAVSYKIATGKWLSLGKLSGTVWGNGIVEMPDGRVEIFGGVQGSNRLAVTNTWLVDANTGAKTAGSPMVAKQELPTVVRARNGLVYALGGWEGNNPIRTAEVLDTKTGKWSAIQSMTTPRSLASAVELPDGRILVIGGWSQFTGSVWVASDTAEVFDPAAGTWSSAGLMNQRRAIETATVLPDGRVLVAGGTTRWDLNDNSASGQTVLDSAEVFDGSQWRPIVSMSVPRASHAAALLPNGHVLVTGGWNSGASLGMSSTEEFDPNTGKWALSTAMPGPHAQARLVTMRDGRLMELAGIEDDSLVTAAVDVFDPQTGSWTRSSSLLEAVYWPVVLVTADGRIVVAGGATDSGMSTTVEVYAPPAR